MDVSHWDVADMYEFDIASDGDRVAQLEGLVEHQTIAERLDTDTISCDTL